MSAVVSLDIGSSALAAVELNHSRDRVSLANAAIEALPEGLVVDGEVTQPEALAVHIQQLWKKAGLKGKRVRLGVANQRVFVRNVEMASIEDAEHRAAAVQFEAAEHIPIPPDSAIVDYQVTETFEDPSSGLRDRVVMVAAHREMVDALVSAVRRAGLTPESIDLEAFALLRSLLPPVPMIDAGSMDQPAQAICHVGASMTNVVIAVNRQCQFTRLFGFGGRQLTQAVVERTSMPVEEAEQVKRAIGLVGGVPNGWDENNTNAIRHALALGARPLVQEIGRSLDYYRSQAFARPIERVILSGGTSLCAGLDQYLAQALGAPVELANPVMQLDDANIDPQIAAHSAVAVGLALDGGDL